MTSRRSTGRPRRWRAFAGPLPRNVWAVGMVSLLTDIGGEMVFPLLPRLLGGMSGVGALAVGVVEGIADALSHAVKPWAGQRSDRSGRRKPMMLVGYGLSGAVRPLLAVVGSIPAATLVRSGDRLGKGIRGAPRDALIAASVPRELWGRAYAFHRAMDHAGAVIGGSVAAGLLWLDLSVRQVIALSAIPGVLAFLAIVFGIREVTRPSLTEPAGSAPDASTAAAHRGLPADLRAYIWILFVFSLAGSTDALLLFHAGAMGLSAAEVAAAWVVLHIVKVVSSVPGGALADRVGPVRTILAGWLLYAGVYAGFAWMTGPMAAWFLFTAYGFFFALTEGAEKALLSRLSPAASRGRAFGLMSLAVGSGALLASVATGLLYQQVGPRLAFGSAAVLATVAAAALLAWSRGSAPHEHH